VDPESFFLLLNLINKCKEKEEEMKEFSKIQSEKNVGMDFKLMTFQGHSFFSDNTGGK